jgi:hypothetical protein
MARSQRSPSIEDFSILVGRKVKSRVKMKTRVYSKAERENV